MSRSLTRWWGRGVSISASARFRLERRAAWEDSHFAAFYRALAGFSRLIVFDKRGTGLSDRVTDVAPLEVRMDDLRAVMDAAGSERAAVIGFSEGSSNGDAVRRHVPGESLGDHPLRWGRSIHEGT